jgi:hypothetical protein
MKRCKHCGEFKPLEDFYGEKGGRDGKRPECKSCTNARRKRWYAQNREREIARVRAWQQANPQRVKAWRTKNRDRLNKQLREIHLRNKFGLTPDEYDRILRRAGRSVAVRVPADAGNLTARRS